MATLQKLDFSEPVAVLGDIHGDADRLELMLRLLGTRRVLCCGDLGDRGPDSRRVLELLIRRGALGVRGNHDEWLIALSNGSFDTFALHAVMGGAATLTSYGITSRTPGGIEADAWRIPALHREFLRNLPLGIDLTVHGDAYWIVHAGVPASVALPAGTAPGDVVSWLADNKPDSLLWSHNPPESALPVDRPVIMGHMPQPEPLDLGHVIAIDTGCGTCPPYELTALLLPERRFLRV